MPWFQKILFLSFITLALNSCSKKGLTLKIGDQDVLALSSIESCNFVQNSQGIRVSWKSSTPVNFMISSSVPTKYDATIEHAAIIWNNYLHKNLINVYRDNNFTNPPSDDKYNVIYFMTTWPADQNMEQARTAIRWDVSKLRDSDIKVNVSNFSLYADGETQVDGQISLLSLMLHEMGHAVGLKHIPDALSVMQTHLGSNTDRNKPGPVDLESLGCEY